MIVLSALLLFGVQAALMLVDEAHFHRKRGLPRWERLGHPLDTLSVLGCYALVLTLPANDTTLALYVFAAAISCILVTKDEFVHARLCSAGEQWLHALLFVLHPAVLGVVALLWRAHEASALLLAQTGLTALFLLYQIVYWNLWRGSIPTPSPASRGPASNSETDRGGEAHATSG